MNGPGGGQTLILLRHGHSAWNLTDRFTGWTDIALTGIGIDEAETAGRRIARAGLGIDEVHVSVLRRTRQSARGPGRRRCRRRADVRHLAPE